MVKQESVNFDYRSIGPGHYDRVFKRNRGIQSKWTHLKFSHIRNELKGCRQYVDVGCGPGTFIGTLPEDIYSVGLDVEPLQINYAQSQYGTKRHQFKLIEKGKRFPLEDNCCDVVTLTDLIEHLPEDSNIFLLREVRRILKKGGFVLITTPNYGSLWPVVEWFVNKLGEVSYEEQHINRYFKKTLFILLQKSGFEDPLVNTYQLFAPFFAGIHWKLADFIHRIEPRFFVSNIGLYLFGKGYK